MDRLTRIQEAFSTLHHQFILDIEPSTKSVLEYLAHALPQIPVDSWIERIQFGGIFVNGIPVTTDAPLPFPCKIEYYEPKFNIREADSIYAPFSSDWIVWQDTWLIVSYKPAKLPTMPAKEQNHYNLKSYLEKFLGCELHCPSRLDMSTQGLVIASKHPSMHKLLQQLFERREIDKRYLFFTTGTLQESPCSVQAPIGKSSEHPVLRSINGKDAKKAVTGFQTISTGCVTSLDGAKLQGNFIEATPKTGRTHQIRVHAASIGCPIVGDRFYGGAPFSNLCLLSHSLSFVHPITEERIAITIPNHLRPSWSTFE